MADYKKYKVGITAKGSWKPMTGYELLDMVLYDVSNGGDGCSYVALRTHAGIVPGTDPTVWVKSTQAGQSIYDLAVKYHHFVGTEEEFEAEYQAALAAANSAAASAIATDNAVKAAEALRVSAEESRVSAEQGRVSAEDLRTDAEGSRVSSESGRAVAESSRVTAENLRVSAETSRATAEASRSNAEGERVVAETARNNAEALRAQQFQVLKGEMETEKEDFDEAEAARALAEAARVSAESSRVEAEAVRVSAEQSRVTAETARETQASSDHNRADSDHTTAAADHTTAGQDHTQAGTDHTRAESDHTQAGDDHIASVAATGSATDAAATANTAAEAADEAREGIQDDLARKANTDGYYGGMTVGSAENLVGRGSVDAEYEGIRTSAGTADIGSGSATIQKMKGRSFVWNQLVQNGNFLTVTGWATKGVTKAANDNVLTVTVDTAGDSGVFRVIELIEGHKYYATVSGKGQKEVWLKISANATGTSGERIVQLNENTWTKISLLGTAQGRQSFSIFQRNSEVGDVFYLKNAMLFDLTLIFGEGNEPSTVEEFEAWRKEMGLTLDYYDYNEGEVINNKAQAIETAGFNLYDPSTGKAFLPGPYSNYPQEYEICGTFSSISFTDVNGNTSVPTLTDGRFFNVDAPGELTVVGGNNTDTLVHLVWSGWRNYGEPDYAFEAYWKNTLNLNLTQLTGKLNGEGESVVIFPDGMRSAGTAHDYLIVDEDGYARKAVKVMESRAYADGDESDATVITDKTNTIYKLATPLTYDLDEPIQMTFMAYHGGTITQTPQAPDSAPIALNMTYALDAVSTLNGLPQDYISAESIDNFLATLSTQMGGTWSRTFNENTGKHEFTFTPNANTNEAES